MSRANAADAAGRPDALALLDAAYVAGAFHEISMFGRDGELRNRAANARQALGNTDAYALIRRSVAARPDDASIQFAAALIASGRDRNAYLQHAEKARSGVTKDALLARNIDHIS